MQVEINEGITSVLIVEDEAVLSMMMEALLIEMGVEEVHTAATVAEALDKAGRLQVDIVVLDLRLLDSMTDEVADKLVERGIPFIFCSGSDLAWAPERHRDRPLLSKPFSDDEFRLIIADTHLLASRRPERVH